MFNCPDNGVAESNSLRIATLDGNGAIESEVAIALSDSYTYQNWRMVLSPFATNGMADFYAVVSTSNACKVFEFIFDGVNYVQGEIFSSDLGLGGPCTIFVDPALAPNDKPYLWFGYIAAEIGGANNRGFKHLYYDGGSWVSSNWICYDNASPTNAMCRYPIDLHITTEKVYVMNNDQKQQASQHSQGKIAL